MGAFAALGLHQQSEKSTALYETDLHEPRYGCERERGIADSGKREGGGCPTFCVIETRAAGTWRLQGHAIGAGSAPYAAAGLHRLRRLNRLVKNGSDFLRR